MGRWQSAGAKSIYIPRFAIKVPLRPLEYLSDRLGTSGPPPCSVKNLIE